MSSTTAPDFSGNNNTATLAGTKATTSQGVGKLGQGFKFDGVDDSLSVAYNSVLNLPDTGGALSVWVNPTGIPVGQDSSQTIFKKRPHSNDNVVGGVALSIYQAGPTSPNYLRVQIGDDTAYDQLTASTTQLLNNKWYHVVLTYTSTTIYIYLNGNLEAQMTRTRAIAWPTALGVYIGTGKTATNPVAFKGTLDEMRLYNRTLSVSEVQSLYRAGGGIVMSAVSSAAASSTGINNGLAGYWTFDKNVTTTSTTTDSSGNGRNGALVNGTLIATGRIKQGLSFDGFDDYVDIPNISFAGPFTFSTWYYTSNNAQTGMIFGEVTGSGSFSPKIGMNAGNFFLRIGTSTSDSSVSLSRANQWHHIVVTRDSSSKIDLYVDGGQANRLFGNVAQTDTYILDKIGANGTLGQHFNGKLDDVRVYTRTLSTNEISNLYKIGKSSLLTRTVGENNPSVGINSGLVGYWTFDGKNMTNATATDSSGSGNNGTLINGPTKVIGKMGQALNFDGINDYISTQLTTNYTRTSISAWIFPLSVGGGTLGRIVDKCENGCAAPVYFAVNTGNKLVFQRNFSTGAGIWKTVGNSFNLNSWNHVVVTYDESSVSNDPIFYVNGILKSIGEVTPPTGVAATTTDRYFIGNRGDTGRAFDGKIDDVRLYNRTLSPTEVKSLYKLGAQ